MLWLWLRPQGLLVLSREEGNTIYRDTIPIFPKNLEEDFIRSYNHGFVPALDGMEYIPRGTGQERLRSNDLIFR